jgi:hypothetical protein
LRDLEDALAGNQKQAGPTPATKPASTAKPSNAEMPIVAAPVSDHSQGGVNYWPGFVTGSIVLVVLLLQWRQRTRKVEPAKPQDEPFHMPLHPVVVARPEELAVPRPDTLIDSIRTLVGRLPRTFEARLADYLRADPPDWLTDASSDELLGAFHDQERLRREGKIAWAAVVQANMFAFELRPFDSPASVIWSDDPFFDAHPAVLSGMCESLFELKGTNPAEADAAAFARMITNELTRGMRLKVPRSIAQGRVVYHSSLMLTRKHLPEGYLARKLLPVFADPQPSGRLLIVPAAFWPASLTQWWKNPDAA